MPYSPSDPLVGVAQDRRLVGVSDLAKQDGVAPLTVHPLSVALSRDWDSDACLVPYLCYIDGEPKELCPRLNKTGPVLKQLRDRGVEVMCSTIILDYDNPGHRPWSPELLEVWQNALDAVFEAGSDFAFNWNWYYTTPHGARLIWTLRKPVRPEVYEAHYRGLIKHFSDYGLNFDPSGADWNHLFAVPKNQREGREPTKEHPYFEVVRNMRSSDKVMGPHSIEEFPQASVEEFEVYERADCVVPEGIPEVDSSIDLVRDRANNRLTDWGKKAQRRLKGRECYDCLFKDQPIAEEGARDDTIHKFVGQAITLLIEIETDLGEVTTPEHIFGLFVESVDQLEPDEDTPDWRAPLWRAIRVWWEKQYSKLKERRKQEEQREADASAQQLNLLNKVTEWCQSPVLFGNEAKAWKWLSRRIIVCLGKSFYVLGDDGYYHGPVNKDMIHSQIVENGIDSAVELYQTTGKGAVQARSPQDLLNEHAITAGASQGRAGGEGHFLEGLENTGQPTLVLSLFRRRKDIVPRYNPDVHTWLTKLFGKSYEMGAKWIAWALAFEDGPICGLSLAGAPGVGKKMFVQAMAECLETPEVATSKDLTGRFQEGLLRSPFVVVNEGFPTQRGLMHPADMFRHLVSGDPTQVEAKFRSAVRCHIPARVIFTANNLEAIRQLSDGRNLSPDDREALAERLLHVDVTTEAADWLRRKGGTDFTAVPGRRWIARDSGGGSDYVVASHFMYLYEQRHHLGKHGAGRFLVSGPLDSTIMFELRTQSGLTPVVIETLLSMLSEPQARWQGKGFVVRKPTETERGQVWCLSAEIKKYYESHWKPGNPRLSAGAINDILRGLVDRATQTIVLPERKKLKVKKWHCLDIDLLLIVARKYGYACSALDQMHEGAEVTEYKDVVEGALTIKKKSKPKKRPKFFA